MRLTTLTALLLATACGEPGIPEEFQLPDGAVDLNATPITVSVYASPVLAQHLREQGRSIDRLEIRARMTGTDGYAPTVSFEDPVKVDPLTIGVQEENSGQPTENVLLKGYPVGRLDVEVRAFWGTQVEPVGVGCVIGQAIDAIPAATHQGRKTSAKVVVKDPAQCF